MKERKIDYNINLYLEGDSWCNQESSWNLMSLQSSKFLFDLDQRFYARNEKINYRLNLPDGKYILILKDSYGDGGVKGNLSYLNSNTVIKIFEFSAGTYQSIDFEVSSQVANQTKRDIKIEVKGDYYSQSETSWNIVDSLGNSIFSENKNFQEEKSEEITLQLEPGQYYLKCMDTYGDGGMSAMISDSNENFTLLKINWNNLNWSKQNGYLKYYKFVI